MKKLWKWLLIIFIIVCAFFFPELLITLGEWVSTLSPLWGSALIGLATTLPWWAGAVIGVGLAYLIDPATTTQVASDVGHAATAVVGAVVSGATKAFSGLLLIGGALALFLLTGKKDKQVILHEPPRLNGQGVNG